ncbi:MAG: 30S ribosomal protein S2 [Patescibacteria group bacterium]
MNQEKQVSGKAETTEKGENIFAGFDFESLKIDVQEMFKAGVYFGHQKSRKNPKMDPYIFGVRNGINIIDLEKTAEKIKEVQDFIRKITAEGQDILLVGTKKQVKKIILDAATVTGMPYVVERWLGGTFTNFPAISKRTRYLRETEEKQERGELSQYTKFEQMKIREELEKLEEKMGGIKNMSKAPGAIFVTGINEDKLAIREAQKKNIPIIALADTNVNPEGIDFIIPANEDALSSLRLMTAFIVQAILEGKKRVVETVPTPKN